MNRAWGLGPLQSGARCAGQTALPRLTLVPREEEPFHAYVAGDGPTTRLLRQTLHDAGASVEIGRCVAPEELIGYGYPDVLFLTDEKCVPSMRCVHAWAARHGVALVVVQETEVAERLRLFDAGVDDVWDPSIDSDEASARVRRLVRRMRQQLGIPDTAFN